MWICDWSLHRLKDRWKAAASPEPGEWGDFEQDLSVRCPFVCSPQARDQQQQTESRSCDQPAELG
ncbi:hypothetical protein ACH5A2_41325, partial [Streptomyces collinus]|uniref:hypothetical protein n=1 Tax=Streptomyces collinus TaxID=42684 RepID=UPI00378E17F0